MAGRKHWKVRRRAPRARIHVNSLTNLVKVDEHGYISEFEERGIPGHEDQCPLINSSSAPLDTFWQSPGGFFSWEAAKVEAPPTWKVPPVPPWTRGKPCTDASNATYHQP